jgi:leader peptidase (prepilin peptidase)/N-methyltransferase
MRGVSGIERLSGGSTRDLAGLAVLGAGMVVVSIWAAPGVSGWLGAGLALIVLAIAAIDARWFIIPNELSAAGFALALINAAVLAQDGITSAVGMALLRGAVVALSFLALRVLYRGVRGRDGIGLGDVKLAGVMGAWLGWVTIPIAVEIAALSAIAVYVVRHFVRGRPLDRTLKFPFGLFLAPSIWLCWLFEVSVLGSSVP